MKNKLGFTLVELSIVLVIIGLLIGGILVGQSLIDSARINKAISFINQADIAVNQFKSKYRALPGDSLAFGGDGDKQIENSSTNSGQAHSFAQYNYEIANFWIHLQQDGFLKNGYTSFSNDATATGLIPDTHFPTIQLSEKNGIVLVNDTRSQTLSSTHHFYICGFDTVTANNNIGDSRKGAMLPTKALAIDQKMDDGIGTGTNWYLVDRGRVFSASEFISAGGTCGTATGYNIDNDKEACCLRIWLDADYDGS